MKTKNSISFIEVNDVRLTVFTSALEKQLFLQTHSDYSLVSSGNAAVEPLYILVDTEGSGFVLTKRAVTYDEAIEIINHYL